MPEYMTYERIEAAAASLYADTAPDKSVPFKKAPSATQRAYRTLGRVFLSTLSLHRSTDAAARAVTREMGGNPDKAHELAYNKSRLLNIRDAVTALDT